MMHKIDCPRIFFVLLLVHLGRGYLDPLLRLCDGSLALTKKSDPA